MRALRYIAAVVAGIVVAGVVVFAVEAAGHAAFPPPEGLDFRDAAQMEAHLRSLPVAAFAFVMAAWALGALLGGIVAALIAPTRKVLMACIIGGFILAGAVTNLVMIPHPPWFAISAPLLVVAATGLAAFVGTRWPRRPD
ncbi:hypothetical protein [Alkalisalibacterium limincola]|uniref:Uncharacterized protein n=1 Tax=Alkalisalibacterium limincola TaxID=2699169 RepID=A0A5C8KNB2_9GAMM|nr:hypothetical protein [Alkalisalibacterium limincola]TXK62303.1 hypothetical protein FU658_08690 [Alkalisalibacterium limincola]